ncbi:MAG: hypothetical protein ACK5VN_03970 [Phycisphaerae bacterium]
MFRTSCFFAASAITSLTATAVAQPTFHIAGIGAELKAVDINEGGAVLMKDATSTNPVTRVWDDGAVTTFSGSDFASAADAINWNFAGCLRRINFEPRRIMNDGTVYGRLSIRFENLPGSFCNPPGTAPGIGIFIARRRGGIGQAGTFEILRDVGEVYSESELGAGVQFAVQEAGDRHVVVWSQYFCTEPGPQTFCSSSQNAFPGSGTGTFVVSYSTSSNSALPDVVYPWSSPVSCQQEEDPCNNGENDFQIGVANASTTDRFEFGSPRGAGACAFTGGSVNPLWVGPAPSPGSVPDVFGSRQVVCDWDPYSPAWERGVFKLSTTSASETPIGTVKLPTLPTAVGTRYLWHDDSQNGNRGLLYDQGVFNSSGEVFLYASRLLTTDNDSEFADDMTDPSALEGVWVRFTGGSVGINPSGIANDSKRAALSESGDFYLLNGIQLLRYNHGLSSPLSTLAEANPKLCQRYTNQPRQGLTVDASSINMWTNDHGDLMYQAGNIYLFHPATNKHYPIVYPGLPIDASRTITGVGGLDANVVLSGNNGSSNLINNWRQMVAELTLSDNSSVVVRIDFSPSNYDVVCGDLDFNNDGVFPDDQDVIDCFDVLSGGNCATCDSVDINRDGVFPDDEDVTCFFIILTGGTCNGACECDI